MLQGDTITRRIAVDPEFIAAVPEMKALLKNPDWRGLNRYVGSFDQEPLTYVQTILSHVRNARPDPQTDLHTDTFHPTVKAFYFLTDVAEDEGPFVYVPGSHRLTPERLAWERELSHPCGEDRRQALRARVAARQRGGDRAHGLCRAARLRRARQHAGRRRHGRFPRPRPLGAAERARRDLDLRAAGIRSCHGRGSISAACPALPSAAFR